MGRLDRSRPPPGKAHMALIHGPVPYAEIIITPLNAVAYPGYVCKVPNPKAGYLVGLPL